MRWTGGFRGLDGLFFVIDLGSYLFPSNSMVKTRGRGL